MKATSKLRFDRLKWEPDTEHPGMLHRFDIFMVSVEMECPTCGHHTLSKQLLVYPSPKGVPRIDSGLIDTDLMTVDDLAWCRAQNKALLEKFPVGHRFWTHGI